MHLGRARRADSRPGRRGEADHRARPRSRRHRSGAPAAAPPTAATQAAAAAPTTAAAALQPRHRRRRLERSRRCGAPRSPTPIPSPPSPTSSGSTRRASSRHCSRPPPTRPRWTPSSPKSPSAPDGSSYTFKLNPKAKFHDGQPVTADDVAFTYTLALNHGHQVQSRLAAVDHQGRRGLLGREARQRLRHRRRWTRRRSASTWSSPTRCSCVETDLADPAQAHSRQRRARGPRKAAVHVRFADRQRSVQGGQEPDRPVVGARRQSGLLSRQARSSTKSSTASSSKPTRRRSRSSAARSTSTRRPPTASTSRRTRSRSFLAQPTCSWSACRIRSRSTLGFNLRTDYWKDKRVRQAMAYAIDRKKIIDSLLGGNAEIVNTPIRHPWVNYKPKNDYALQSGQGQAVADRRRVGLQPDGDRQLAAGSAPRRTAPRAPRSRRSSRRSA